MFGIRAGNAESSGNSEGEINMLPEKIVDSHVHLFPDNLFDAIWKQFSVKYGWTVLHHLYHDKCIEYLRARDVSLIIFSNYAHKRGVAKGLNEWNTRVIDRFPGVYCFGAYHPDDEDSLQMAEKLLRHPKVLGFKLQHLVQSFYPDDERLFPLYEMIIRSGKRILFHVGTAPFRSEFVGISHFRKVLKRYPELSATVAHMGAYEYEEFFELLDMYPQLYMDTTYAFLPDIPMCYDLGPEYLERYKDRILYGSDFPNVIFPREIEIENLLQLKLSQEFYTKVFWENGVSLIKEITHDNNVGSYESPKKTLIIQ